MNRKHLAIASILIILVGVVAMVSSRSDKGRGSSQPDTGASAPAQPSDAPSFVPSASSNIYVIDVATRSLAQITRNDRQQITSGPAWSRKGQIVFSEEGTGDQIPRLFVVTPDGSSRREVSMRARGLFGATWAPDGQRLAAQRLGSGIHVLDVRTGTVHRLEATSERDDAPAWSPDGETILFQRQVTGTNLELYAIGATGTGLRRLTRDPLQQIGPAWSPDGSRVAFGEQQKTGNWAVSSMKLDGSDRRVLTDPKLSSQDPAWSPDGKRIAFVIQEDTRDSIAVMDAEGGKPQRITPPSLAIATNPFWSPDGKKIVFTARRAERPPPARSPGL